MADTITKILIRQGTDVQRRTANLTGVIFSSGEPGYCVDTKRLYVGDGVTAGGNAIGIQNIGKVNNLFGTYQNGFTFEGIARFTSKGAATGDIVYDSTTRGLYALTSVNTFPPLSSELVRYDFSTLVNPSQFEYDTQQRLQLKDQAVNPRNLSFTVVDNYTIGKASLTSPISLLEDSVENRFLAPLPADTVKGNFTAVVDNPQDLYVYPGTFVGRTASSRLSCYPFSTILQQATFNAQNGIVIDQSVSPPIFKLDPNIFTATNTSIALRKPTTVLGTLDISGNTTVTGTLRATNDIVAYYSSDASLKTNVTLIEDALNKVEKINGVTFDWNEQAEEKYGKVGREAGVIAQDVESVLPEVVITREDGTKAVRYEKLIPLLIEAIKELKKEVTELKNK